MIESLNNIIFYIGYIIVLLGLILLIMHLGSFVIKFPRKVFYNHLQKLVIKEPKVFDRFTKYLKHREKQRKIKK